jgi:molecular chaperone GrpE
MEENKKQASEASEEKTEAAPENTATPDEKEGKKEKEKEKEKKPSELDRLKAETESLKQQLADANDKYLRMLAEYDNFRRRSAKERQGVWADAVSDTVKALLPIADNLERAAASDGDAETVRRGLEMTLKALHEMLTKQGMEAFGEVGETFDPALHNAVMHIEDENLGENQVAEVFQRGYRIGDKIVRFAMVKVAN